MDSVADWVKHFLVPGSPTFLMCGLALGLALTYGQRTAPWGRRWLALLLAFYIVAGMPVVAGFLQHGPGTITHVVERIEQADGARVVVVLGTGAVTIGTPERRLNLPALNTAQNVVEGARLYQLLNRPRMIVSGGMPPGGAGRVSESAVMRDYLTRLGVRPDDIVEEHSSINTFEQARNVAALLKRSEPCVVVTVPVHMPRALGLMDALGVRAVPSASGIMSRDLNVKATWQQLIPDRYSLRASEDAIYEQMATVLYRVRGQFAKR